MSHESVSSVRSRALFVFILTFHMCVICYAVFVQQVKGDELRNRGVRQGAEKQEINGKRGAIMDIQGRKLAMDIRTFSIYAVPVDIKDKSASAYKIAPVLGLSSRDTLSKISNKKNFVWIKRFASEEEAQRIRNLKIHGVGMLPEMGRVYPKGESAAAIVGIKGTDSGMEGIEYSLEDWLKGEPGYVVLKKDATGRTVPFSVKKRVSPRIGSDAYLTIDMTIQYFAEAALKQTIVDHNAKAGSVIVMRPKTGEILAMAGYPSYDPNNFRNYDQLQFRNRPIWKVFEPGSVLKPIVASMAIDAGIVDPFKDTFYCEPSMVIDRRRIGEHDSKGLPAHKSVTEIIAKSYNTGSAKIALKLGDDRLAEYLDLYNFGRKYDGLLLGGQEKGLLPQDKHWKDIKVATIGYGQGIGTTALQVAVAFSALANGGVIYDPAIVDSIVSSKGKELFKFEPRPVRRAVSKETARVMRYMMHQVVENGTGDKAKVPGYTVAGKTGTAKVPGPNGYEAGKYISSFVGFAPVEDPELLVMVVVEYPWPNYYAGDVAAPAFSEIMRKSLWHLNVPPSPEDGKSAGY